jgi:hypothetical protein
VLKHWGRLSCRRWTQLGTSKAPREAPLAAEHLREAQNEMRRCRGDRQCHAGYVGNHHVPCQVLAVLHRSGGSKIFDFMSIKIVCLVLKINILWIFLLAKHHLKVPGNTLLAEAAHPTPQEEAECIFRSCDLNTKASLLDLRFNFSAPMLALRVIQLLLHIFYALHINPSLSCCLEAYFRRSRSWTFGETIL